MNWDRVQGQWRVVICQLVRRRRPLIRFLYIGPYLLLHASFRPHLAVTPLRFTTLHLHQWDGTCTRKLSNLHGVQRKRLRCEPGGVGFSLLRDGLAAR
jgi:hypothetical protein